MQLRGCKLPCKREGPATPRSALIFAEDLYLHSNLRHQWALTAAALCLEEDAGKLDHTNTCLDIRWAVSMSDRSCLSSQIFGLWRWKLVGHLSFDPSNV